MNFTEIKELTEWLEKSSFTSYSLSINGVQLSISKQQAVTYLPKELPPEILSAAPSHNMAEQSNYALTNLQVPCDNTHIIYSPIVGIFYESASPESSAFVQVGQSVKKGDILCILEAMKIMNEIVADVDGVVTEICVSNGNMVEACMPLFKIEAV
ncbi:MAG: acetyl-CoA carboxylase biotin carboxyl carrier protein [Firmicutes bacterium]|nr:acetyl-CoA carboxylase biotin carboxyl carrier protein [Bacillota bacterium]